MNLLVDFFSSLKWAYVWRVCIGHICVWLCMQYLRVQWGEGQLICFLFLFFAFFSLFFYWFFFFFFIALFSLGPKREGPNITELHTPKPKCNTIFFYIIMHVCMYLCAWYFFAFFLFHSFLFFYLFTTNFHIYTKYSIIGMLLGYMLFLCLTI